MSTSHDPKPDVFVLTDSVMAALECAENDRDVVELLDLGPPELLLTIQEPDSPERDTLIRILQESKPKETEAWQFLNALNLWTDDPASAKRLYLAILEILRKSPRISFANAVAKARKEDSQISPRTSERLRVGYQQESSPPMTASRPLGLRRIVNWFRRGR
jgi:hypothetical protein